MKKEWITPQAFVEEFTTNEYLNMCSTIACDRPWSYHGEVHSNTGCRNSKNQVLRDLDDDGHFDQLFEKKNGDWLPCTLYNKDYKTPLSKDDLYDLTNDSDLYWTTKYGLVTYHHHGKVNIQNTNRPNHS